MSPLNHKGDSAREILRLIKFSKVERTQFTMQERLFLLKPGVAPSNVRLQCAANIWPMLWGG